MKEHQWVSEERDGVVDWYTHTECTVCGAAQGELLMTGQPFAFLPGSGGHCRLSLADCDLAQKQIAEYRAEEARREAELATMRKRYKPKTSNAIVCCVVLPDLARLLALGNHKETVLPTI